MKNFILLSLLSIFLLSCNKKEIVKAQLVDVNGNKIVSLNINSLKDTVDLKLSSIVDDIQLIQLEDVEEAYFKYGNVTVSANYIVINGSEGVILFDKNTGKYHGKIGNKGRGPGEYFSIYSIEVDEKNNKVYMLPWQQKQVNVYELPSGNFLEAIPIAYQTPKAHIKVFPEDEKIIIIKLAFKGYDSTMIWEQDFKANIIKDIPSAGFELERDFSNEIFVSKYNDQMYFSYLTWKGAADTLYNYNYKTGKIKPIFTIDFNSNNSNKGNIDYNSSEFNKIPIHRYLEIPNYYISDVSFPVQLASGNWTTSEPKNILVNKNTLETSYFNLIDDFHGNIKLFPNIDQNYFIYNNTPDAFINLVGKDSEYAKQINLDGNNIMIIGKLKQ